MFIIQFQNLKIFAHHGLYEEERILGNWFEVNITILCNAIAQEVTIHDTINYESVFNLVKARMLQPAPLLENITADLAKKILKQFHLAEKVTVRISKLSPPIAGFNGDVNVSFTVKRKNNKNEEDISF